MYGEKETKFKCPHCGKFLTFDYGEPQSWEHPGEQAGYYCKECLEYDSPVPPKTPDGWLYTVDDIAKLYGYEKSFGDVVGFIEKQVYKFTECGCIFGLSFEPHYQVYIMPYTEGFDGEHTPFYLEFPFTTKNWYKTLKQADKIGSDCYKCVNEHNHDCFCWM